VVVVRVACMGVERDGKAVVVRNTWRTHKLSRSSIGSLRRQRFLGLPMGILVIDRRDGGRDIPVLVATATTHEDRIQDLLKSKVNEQNSVDRNAVLNDNVLTVYRNLAVEVRADANNLPDARRKAVEHLGLRGGFVVALGWLAGGVAGVALCAALMVIAMVTAWVALGRAAAIR
jgi:hypothetical protein